jgi:hypothetical protein
MEWLEGKRASANGVSETRLSFLVRHADRDMRDYSELVDWIPVC